MSEFLIDKKKMLKELIKQLHLGVSPDVIKDKFKEVLKDTSPEDISKIEEELIKDGMPREEIQRLCNVHLAVFKESIEKEKILPQQGHPVHTLMEEHKILLQFTENMKNIIEEIKNATDFDSISEEIKELNHISEHLKSSESHYVREENVLFPYLEKHGITGPPAIMWSEHNEIRKIKKEIYNAIDNYKNIGIQDFVKTLTNVSISLYETLHSHFYKENNILFPTALKVIAEDEWMDIKNQFDELGYCCFTPEYAKKEIEKEKISKPSIPEGQIAFETGNFSNEELESLLNTLPIDITFVDKEDTVRYFNQSKERIFPRTKAVIGRKVQLCHPKESLHKVEQILNDFKNNKRDVAEFWINLHGRLIYIRYFAIRKGSEYLGTLEVTQDITDIKKIEGEKRLLD
jgi:PAS domain S-box-containing protein